MSEAVAKIKKLIKNHKGLFVVTVLGLVLFVFIFIIVVIMMTSGKDKYGDRLTGIEEVAIKSSDITEFEGTLSEKEEVSSASIRIQGKIIYVNLKFEDGVGLDKAKEVAVSSLELFDDEEKSYYDICYFLINEGENGYSITGTKHSSLDSISWIRS